MKNGKFKICLMGASLDTGNLGVSALTVSLVKMFFKVKPAAEITLIASTLSDDVQEAELNNGYVKLDTISLRLSPKAPKNSNIFYILILATLYRTIPSKRIRKHITVSNSCIRKILEADLIGQISGGDSFSDLYGLKRMLFIVLPSLYAILLKKKFVLLPQTFGPYNTPIGKILSSLVIKNSSHIIARDFQGIEYLKNKFNIRSIYRNIQFCPDVAFQLDATKPETIRIVPSMETLRKRPIIGLNISGLLYLGGYKRNNMFGLKFNYKEFIQQTIVSVINQTDANILIVPHTLGSASSHAETDQNACNEVAHSMSRIYSNRIFWVNLKALNYNQSEIKFIIGMCDFFIGSRMHSCIAALSQGIPTIGVAYSKKFKGVFESIGVGSMVVDARKISIENCISRIIESYNNRENIRRQINSLISEVKTKIEKVFLEIVE